MSDKTQKAIAEREKRTREANNPKPDKKPKAETVEPAVEVSE